jgi:4-amino-4-deoxy-L-arabinose transferase-like glycosyltransferase
MLGIAMGAYALHDIPSVMVQDEGAFWENARAIALKQFQPVFFDSGVYTFPVASTILQGWLMRLFGVTVWGWRFASVLMGVAAVIPLYLLGKEWLGRRVAIVTCILMLANPYFLSFARLGYNNIGFVSLSAVFVDDWSSAVIFILLAGLWRNSGPIRTRLFGQASSVVRGLCICV